MAVNLSPIWGAGAQLLDNSGNVLSGGKIYTYLAGTTTPAVTYTSSNGNTANSNPIILNSAGRVPYEIWLTDSIEYKFVLKDSNDVLIGTWDNLIGINSNFINYYGQQEIQTATAGQTVFTLTEFDYQPGTGNLSVFVDGVNQYGPGAQYAYVETDSSTITFVSGLHVGASVKFTTIKLENPGVADASQVSYTYPDSNAVTESVEDRLAQYVSVKDFGAVGDGVTDDSSAFNAAILSLVANNSSGVVLVPNATYKIEDTVYIPSNITIDLCQSTIVGPGVASSVAVFETGYYTGSAIITNVGTPNESHIVQGAKITNGRINDAGYAINLFDFVYGSEVSNIIFYDCTYAVNSLRSFYARYINLTSRGSASGATAAPFTFTDNVAVERIESLVVSSRVTGIEFAGTVLGIVLATSSVEGSTTGVKLSGTGSGGADVGPFKLDSCYFELITGDCLLLSNGGDDKPITIDNCFFSDSNNVIKAPSGDQSNINLKENNRFSNISGNIIYNQNDKRASGLIEISPQYIAYTDYPSIPSAYTLTKANRVSADSVAYDPNTLEPVIKTKVTGDSLIAFNHVGDAGSAVTSTIAFTNLSKTAGTSFSIIVDTKIKYQPLSALLGFRFQISDEVSTYNLWGNIYGDIVEQLDSSGKTITISSQAGYVRLTIGTFSSFTQTYIATGVLRHL